MQVRTKQQCYDSIAKANYQGPRRGFDFSSYVAIHQQAHQDLSRLENPSQKIKRLGIFYMESQIPNVVISNLTS